MSNRTAVVLSVLLAGTSCPASEPAVLREDYQVIQRDQANQGNCIVELSAALKGKARFRFTIEEGRRAVRSGMLAARELGDKQHGLLLEKIPIGGPYTITFTPEGVEG